MSTPDENWALKALVALECILAKWDMQRYGLLELYPILASEPADKPGSVSPAGAGAAIIYLSGPPGGQWERAAPNPQLVRDFLLLGLAPGGGCPAGDVATAAGVLLPHRFTLANRSIPQQVRDFSWQYTSLLPFTDGSLRLAVSQHRALRSPDFPHPT